MSNLDSIDSAIGDALTSLRKDPGTGVDWVLCGFSSPDSSNFVLLGSGSGGVEALAQVVPENDVAYGVVRREYEYDSSGGGMGSTKVTKFIRICWRPESKIPMKRKMKITTLDGSIKKVLGSTHSDLEAEVTSELNDAEIVHIIERITQKKDAVASAEGKQASTFLMGGVAHNARNAAGDSVAAKAKQDGYLDTNNLTGGAKGAEVSFAEVDTVKAAIQQVRENKDPTNWCLTGYLDKKTIGLIGTGTGDISEMLAACKDATVCYGLFRVTEQIDKTTAVKFCFLVWQPDDVPVMSRAAISTHKGVVTPMFRPFHVDFQATTRDELTHEKVMDHIMSLSGTKSKVTDKAPDQKVEVYERKMLGGVKAEEVHVEFDNKEALVAAIKQVRDNKDPTTWAVAYFAGDPKNIKLTFKGQGEGGLEEFSSALCSDQSVLAYGIFRMNQTVDMSTVVKFVFVTYKGPDTPPLVSAKVSTLRGGVLPVFQPFHADIFIDSTAELTEEIVLQRLK